MSDLKRLIDSGSEATRAERRLLAQALSLGPTKAQQDAVWSALAPTLSQLPPGPIHGGAGATPSTGLGASVTAKGGAVLLAVALTLGGVAARNAIVAPHPAHTDDTPEHSRPRGSPSQAALPGRATALVPPVEPQAAPPPLPLAMPAGTAAGGREPHGAYVPARPRIAISNVPEASSAPSATAATDAVVAAEDVPRQQAAPASSSALALSLSNLREESLALEAVRAALLSGDLAAARVRLDSVRARFPRGTLAQEQRQLSVEIAGRGGDATRAAAEAAAFLKDYPSSPHAVAVRRWLPSP